MSVSEMLCQVERVESNGSHKRWDLLCLTATEHRNNVQHYNTSLTFKTSRKQNWLMSGEIKRPTLPLQQLIDYVIHGWFRLQALTLGVYLETTRVSCY